jgi:hypothetical protein
VPLGPGLADPAAQLLFHETAPNALDPSYVFAPEKGYPDHNYYKISMGVGFQETGLRNSQGKKVETTIFGYGQDGDFRWPGKTIVVQSSRAGGPEKTYIEWHNELDVDHILPVDPTLHWAFSLEGYEEYSIAKNGVPVIPHLHGGHTEFQYDGNAEYFFTPNFKVIGPQWERLVPGGFTNVFEYNNNDTAHALWFHDHTLGELLPLHLDEDRCLNKPSHLPLLNVWLQNTFSRNYSSECVRRTGLLLYRQRPS